MERALQIYPLVIHMVLQTWEITILIGKSSNEMGCVPWLCQITRGPFRWLYQCPLVKSPWGTSPWNTIEYNRYHETSHGDYHLWFSSAMHSNAAVYGGYNQLTPLPLAASVNPSQDICIMARTDARATLGLDEAIDRCLTYGEMKRYNWNNQVSWEYMRMSVFIFVYTCLCMRVCNVIQCNSI